MSGPETYQPDDHLLEDFLAGNSEVSRAYRAAANPPAPPTLDDPVLKIARDELGHPVIVRASVSRWRRLRLPVALAATLVLSFSVLLSVQRDQQARQMAFEMAPPAAPAPTTPITTMDSVAEAGVSAVAEPAVEADAALAELAAPAPPRAGTPEVKGTLGPFQRAGQRMEQFPESQSLEPPAAAVATPPPAPALAKSKDAVGATGWAASPKPKPEMPPPRARTDQAPAKSPAARKEEEAAPARRALERREQKQNVLMQAPVEAAARAPASAPPAEQPAVPTSALAVSADEAVIEKPLPWLARIRALRDEQRLDAARAELAAFQRAFPNHLLPEDLQALAEAPANSSSADK